MTNHENLLTQTLKFLNIMTNHKNLLTQNLKL
jgi:hypothetical protein